MPGLVNLETGQVEPFADSVAAEKALAAGTHSFPAGSDVAVVGPDGQMGLTPSAGAFHALQSGYRLASDSALASERDRIARQRYAESGMGTANALAMGYIEGIPFVGAPILEGILRARARFAGTSVAEQRADLAAVAERNPGTRMAGEALGLVATTLATGGAAGGAGLAARGAGAATKVAFGPGRALFAAGGAVEAQGAALAARAGLAGSGLLPTTSRAAAGLAARGAVEGAMLGAQQAAVDESVLGDKDFTVDILTAGALRGALFGAAGGAGLGALGPLASSAKKAIVHQAARRLDPTDWAIRATGATPAQTAKLRERFGEAAWQRAGDMMLHDVPKAAGKSSLAQTSVEEIAAAGEALKKRYGTAIHGVMEELDRLAPPYAGAPAELRKAASKLDADAARLNADAARAWADAHRTGEFAAADAMVARNAAVRLERMPAEPVIIRPSDALAATGRRLEAEAAAARASAGPRAEAADRAMRGAAREAMAARRAGDAAEEARLAGEVRASRLARDAAERAAVSAERQASEFRGELGSAVAEEQAADTAERAAAQAAKAEAAHRFAAEQESVAGVAARQARLEAERASVVATQATEKAKAFRDELRAAADAESRKANAVRPDVTRIAERYRREVIAPLREARAPETLLSSLEAFPAELEAGGESMGFEALWKHRGILDDLKKEAFAQRSDVRARSFLAFRGIVEDELRAAADRAAAAAGSPSLVRTYVTAKADYTAARWIADTAGNRAPALAGWASPSLRGIGGMAIGGSVGGILGVVGGGVAMNYWRQRGNQVMATVLDKVSTFATVRRAVDLARADLRRIRMAVAETREPKIVAQSEVERDKVIRAVRAGHLSPDAVVGRVAELAPQFAAHAPGAASAMLPRLLVVASRLFAALPAPDRRSIEGDIQAHLGADAPVAASRSDLDRFARVWRAANDPIRAVLDELASNRPHPITGQVVRELYPSVFEAIRETTMREVARAKERLPRPKLYAISALLDIPTTPMLVPERLSSVQATYATAPPLKPPAAGRTGKTSRLAVRRSLSSDAETLGA